MYLNSVGRDRCELKGRKQLGEQMIYVELCRREFLGKAATMLTDDQLYL